MWMDFSQEKNTLEVFLQPQGDAAAVQAVLTEQVMPLIPECKLEEQETSFLNYLKRKYKNQVAQAGMMQQNSQQGSFPFNQQMAQQQQ